MEVDEPGPGDLDPLEVGRGVGVEVVDQLTGQLAGVAVSLLGRGEGDVGGPVPVFLAGRSLQVDPLGQRVDGQRHQGVAHSGSEGVADHGVPFGDRLRRAGQTPDRIV